MKWLVLQLLTLYCLVITPVTGSLRGKPIYIPEHRDFIVPKPILRDCEKIPNIHECRRYCNFDIECNTGDYCCSSSCGNVCMKIAEPETSIENDNPSTTVATM
ncbi:protein WFDC10B-like [Mustela erminea]|uniref:protein WFDC10B-like n=1 Tax=Mustela erminea TaxID=36723 RepID=UPI0013873E44|nr:protein WFDC10B-like [Mustela erminea]